MIKNTEAFYLRAREYQDKRAELTADHEKKLEDISKYEGSKGYRKDKEAIDADYNEKLKALQDEYRSSLNTIMDGMKDNISKRGVNPPTNEMVNLLHMLKMRKQVSEEDLDRVAVMMNGNPIALGIVQDVANDNGIHHNYRAMSKEMSNDDANRELDYMRREVEDWLQYDTSYASRLACKYMADHHGVDTEPVHKRKLFEDEAGCYHDLAGLTNDELKLFSDVVDGNDQ